uniref:Uncharacterized protein n=1 Tax=Plectus sambesii TaxID=2011161 RepID=A0A914USN8_9BILA
MQASSVPTDVEALKIPPMYKSYERRNPNGSGFLKETFLRYDSKDYRGYRAGSRSLFFASQRSLQLLNTTADIYTDGIFETTPGLFSQFYTIHVRYQGGKHTIPCLYIFMPNWQKQTYIKVLHLKQLCLQMSLLLLYHDRLRTGRSGSFPASMTES